MRVPALVALLAVLLSFDASAPAQVTSAPSTGPARDAEAMAALDKMGASLRALTSFSVTNQITDEEVLISGQKIQSGGTITMRARRPDRLRVDSASDRKVREIYYDGKTVTVFAPKMGYYATFPGAPTILETLKRGEDRFGFTVPLADLFSWGSDPSVSAKVTSAFKVDSETIGDQKCDHYAMRQPGIDWQVWIRQGDQALPCKVVITTTDDPSMPQYTVLLTWQLGETFSDDIFAFSPPPDTKKIVMGQVASSKGSAQ